MAEGLGEIGTRILAAVEACRAQGMVIGRRRFGVFYRRGGWRADAEPWAQAPVVCPIGALLLHEQPPNLQGAGLWEVLGFSPGLLDGFVHGFDGHSMRGQCAEYRQGYALGRAIAAEVLENPTA